MNETKPQFSSPLGVAFLRLALNRLEVDDHLTSDQLAQEVERIYLERRLFVVARDQPGTGE